MFGKLALAVNTNDGLNATQAALVVSPVWYPLDITGKTMFVGTKANGQLLKAAYVFMSPQNIHYSAWLIGVQKVMPSWNIGWTWRNTSADHLNNGKSSTT